MNYTNDISENYIASGILNSPEKVIPQLRGEGITSEYFHLYLPKLIWRTANQFLDEGRIHEIGKLEFTHEIKGTVKGRELTSDISYIRSEWCGFEIMKCHLKTLKKMYATRFAQKSLSDALQALEGGESPETVSDASRSAGEGIMAILESQVGFKDAKQSSSEFADLLRAIHKDKSTSGVPTGIFQIDSITGGLGKNELWVIGAQTSGGKTVLMLQMMNNFITLGKRVLLFSLETEANMIHARLASNSKNIDMGKILGKSLTPLVKSDLIRLSDYIKESSENSNLVICDEDSITLESISAKAQQVSDIGGLDLIVVDYIQLVALTNSQDKARHEQVAEVTRTMKQLAKKFQCPVLTATQLNDDGRVRESRAIAHDADVLLTICDDSNGVYVAKNRNGERDTTLQLSLNGAYQRFE
jgi:replicative DNA helicase